MSRVLILLFLATHFTFASIHPIDGKRSGPIDSACLAQARELATIIDALPHPAHWDYYVLCNQNLWADALRRADNHDTDWAFTSLKDHKTFMNGTMFQRRSEMPDGITPEFIIAHELGHIETGSGSEDTANCWARQHPVRSRK